MCRNEQIDRCCGHGRSDAAMRKRSADRARDVGVRDELAERKRRNGSPNVNLKRAPAKCERQIEAAKPSGEIRANLRQRFGKQRVGRVAFASLSGRNERTADDRSIVAYDH
jgi:hypothetical protein